MSSSLHPLFQSALLFLCRGERMTKGNAEVYSLHYWALCSENQPSFWYCLTGKKNNKQIDSPHFKARLSFLRRCVTHQGFYGVLYIKLSKAWNKTSSRSTHSAFAHKCLIFLWRIPPWKEDNTNSGANSRTGCIYHRENCRASCSIFKILL